MAKKTKESYVERLDESMEQEEQTNGFISRRKLITSIGLAGVAVASSGLLPMGKAYASGHYCISTTIAGIRAETMPDADTVYHVSDPGQEGFFQYDAADTTSADNTGTILVSASGGRFKRIIDGPWNVKWFGAKGDRVTDDSLAIRNTIEAAVLATNEVNPNYLGIHPRIYFPHGVYRITSNNLFSDITYTDYTGFNKRGITYAGDNMFSSILYLETGGVEKWFYNNGENNPQFDRLHFLDLGFTSDDKTNGNGFKMWSSGKEKQFKFYRCSFGWSPYLSMGGEVTGNGGINDVFSTLGTANADLIKFHSCDVWCNGNVLTLNNQQSVVHEFIATDIITYKDVVKVEQGGGGTVHFYGGSFMLFMKTGEESIPRYILNVVDNAIVGVGNGDFLFSGIKVEMHGINRGIVKSEGHSTTTQVLFSGSNFHTVSGGLRDAVRIGANKRVVFDNCILSEYLKYVVIGTWGTVNGASAGGLLTFENCVTGFVTSPLYSRIDIQTAGRVIARDCSQWGGTQVLHKKVCDFDINKQNALAREPATPLKLIHIKNSVEPFPYSDGTTYSTTVEFPVNTLIKSIYVKKPASGSSTVTYQLFIGTDDKSVVLGSSTQGPFKDEHFIDLRDLYLVTSSANSKLRLWGVGSGSTFQTGGIAFIEYY